MKKARVVEWKSELTEEEYLDYRKHGINSSVWYIKSFAGHSSKLKKRLFDKGYRDEEVLVKYDDGTSKNVNIIEEILQSLEDNSYLRDDDIVENLMESFKRRGFGYKMAVMKVTQKGIPKAEAEAFERLFEDPEEHFDAMDRIYNKVSRSSRYGKAPEYQKSMLVKSKLYERGFDSDTIQLWIEDREPWE